VKATEANLLKFLRKSPQFVIPIYQRNYSWTAAQCRQLWVDLMRAGRDPKVSAHFIGSIVYVERGLSSVTSQEALLVIDGQQRLTTSMHSRTRSFATTTCSTLTKMASAISS
jgi:uncharacterized protein with ParB-like and HNH nuclease domain